MPHFMDAIKTHVRQYTVMSMPSSQTWHFKNDRGVQMQLRWFVAESRSLWRACRSPSLLMCSVCHMSKREAQVMGCV